MIEKKEKENLIYSGKIITVRQDDVILENGISAKREIVIHPGAVAILVRKDNYIWLVKQFRYSMGEYVLEIPAGKIDKGELPIDAAIRELKEEIGFIPNNLKELGEIYPTPGYTNEVIYLYFVDDFTKGKINPDEDEFIDILKVKVEDFIQLIQENKIKDSKTIVAFYKHLLIK